MVVGGPGPPYRGCVLSAVLPCERCGAWSGGAALCPGCGAARGARAPLDRIDEGAPPWVWVWRGSAEAVDGALAEAPARGDEARARVGAARAVARRLGGGPLEVRLDLRPSEAASHVTRRSRRGNRLETHWVHPWLVASGPAGEVRVVRYGHQQVVRRYGADEAEADPSGFTLDEVRVNTPRGGARFPVRGPGGLGALDLAAVAPGVPGLDRPLPPTAPGGAQAASGGLLLGVAAAAALLLLLPLGARALAARWPAVGGVAAARAAARVALLASEPELRREGLERAAALRPAERLRALLRAARHDPDPVVRAAGLTLLAREPLGPAALARLGQERGAPTPLRAQAARLLVEADPVRAVSLARAGLERGERDEALRRAWVRALAHAPASERPDAVEALLAALDDPASAVRTEAATSLRALGPERLAAAEVRRAFERARAEAASGSPQAELALLTFAGALAGSPAGEALLAAAAEDPELSEGLRRALLRLGSR